MRPFLVIAGLFGAMAIAMGAWAAHGLSGQPTQGFAEKASLYQLLHAVALAAVALLAGGGHKDRLIRLAGGLFILGILLFSGSLYMRAITDAPLAFPLLTPIGGICLILGWIGLAAAGLGTRRH